MTVAERRKANRMRIAESRGEPQGERLTPPFTGPELMYLRKVGAGSADRSADRGKTEYAGGWKSSKALRFGNE